MTTKTFKTNAAAERFLAAHYVTVNQHEYIGQVVTSVSSWFEVVLMNGVPVRLVK